MNALILTVYLGERARAGGAVASDALGALFAGSGVRTAALLRGSEGFGMHRALRTRRVLTLSEDLPLMWRAVGAPDRVTALAARVDELLPQGLVTLERAVASDRPRDLAPDGDGTAKATIYVGRGVRAGARLAMHAVVDGLREHGVEGASAFLGVDGVRDGVRRRASFLGRNRDVPAMIVAVGERARLAAALADLDGLLNGGAMLTLERVGLLRRDGAALAPLPAPPPPEDGAAIWWKVTVHTGTDRTVPGGEEPLHTALVRGLGAAGAGGATSLAGVWGYSGDGPPHGDRFTSLRRRVPVAVTCVDAPERVAALWPVVERLTARSGLVTLEAVPAFRAAGPGGRHGGLVLTPPP